MQLLPETVTESPAGEIQRQSGTREDAFRGPAHGVSIFAVVQMGERRTSQILSIFVLDLILTPVQLKIHPTPPR